MAAAEELSPAPVKKLSLKEVARRFEAGDGDVLEDYRTRNLRESSEQLQATLLQNMPGAKPRLKELVAVAQELQGRAAGRNSEDAAQIKQGLLELQAQWKSYEQSAKQAAKELTENAAAAAAANQEAESVKEAHFQARIEQLEYEVATLRNQVTERDASIQQLELRLEAAHNCEASDQKENHSPMRDSSNFGSELAPAQLLLSSPARRSLVKRVPTMPALCEEAASPALLDMLSIAGSPRVGKTLSVVAGDRPAPNHLPLQWLRAGPQDGQPCPISGAVRHQYSPEVADVGCTISCCVGAARDTASENSSVLKASSPVTAEPGLEAEAAQLEADGGCTFDVVPVQHNGVVQRKRTVASLRVGPAGLAVSVKDVEIATAHYHADMQVCGARGGGDGAAQGMFLALNASHVFMLALETPWKRNVCISLVRKMAAKHGLQLDGPCESG